MKGKSLPIILAVTIMMLMLAVISATAQGSIPQDDFKAQEAVGSAFTYQGQLKNGNTPVDSSCDFQFSLFDAASSGSQVGSTQTSIGIAVNDGLFTVNLDFGSTAFNGNARWLEIQVRCPTGSGSYTTLTPLQKLTPAPYALSLVPGAVISGTATNVIKVFNTTTSSRADGIYSRTDAPNSNGVSGIAGHTTSEAWGVYGRSYSSDGTGVFGHASSISGWTSGVTGMNFSDEGNGVFGKANATTGWVNGVYGESSSPDGRGVYGRNDAVTGQAIGVYGESSSPNGRAIYGAVITTTSGPSVGVYGENGAPNGNGVFGISTATTGESWGVYGYSDSSDGIGVFGLNNSGGSGVVARSVSGNPIEAYGSDDADREFYVSNTGDVYADGTYQSPAADFAEMLPAHAGLEPGDVLVIGSDGKLVRSTQAYQATVVGVHSTRPGFLGGVDEGADLTGTVPLAVIGIVPVKASAENGCIQPGDLLTTASIPGHAMRAEPITLDGISFYPSGVTIGKALEALESDTGIIQMLVMLQ